MTTVEQNKTLVCRVHEAGINQNKPSVYDKVIAPDFFFHDVSMQPGPAGFATEVGKWTSAFSDFNVTVDSVFGEGDDVFNRGIVSGTHTGVFDGIPATGKSVHFAYFDHWVVKDGKLSECWAQLDYYGLTQQLGVIPQPQAS